MPIMSKSTALTVYRADQLPTEADLLKVAFQPIDSTADERSVGAVNIDDYLDNGWHKSPAQKSHFLTFGLRVDTRRVPGAVLKKHLTQALEQEKQELRNKGKKTFISKERKAELKDQVMLKLRAKAEPVPATFDAVIDLNSKLVYFASSSKKPKEYLEALWQKMTGESLVDMHPGHLFEEHNPDAHSLFVDASDFLTGIFNDGLDYGGVFFTVPAKATLTSVEKRAVVALDATGDSADLNALSSPMEDRKVAKATLELDDGENAFTLTVRAVDFGINGLKTPKVDTKLADEDEPDGPFLEKMHLIGKAVEHLHAAYRASLPTTAAGAAAGEDF